MSTVFRVFFFNCSQVFPKILLGSMEVFLLNVNSDLQVCTKGPM